MTRDEYYNSLYLAHHGIKGQKWGQRRFQNEDGTYTELGAERRRTGEGSSKKSGMSDRTKTALKVGAAVAGTALATFGAYKLRQAVDIPYVTHMAAKRAGETISKAGGTKVGKFVGKTLRDAGKAAAGGALGAIGVIAVNKATSHFKDKEGDSQSKKNSNYIKRELVSAAIRSVTGSSVNQVKNGFKSSGNAEKAYSSEEVEAKVGAPKQVHEWGSKETDRRYNDLMQRYSNDKSIRSAIKDMRHKKYDIDQIEKMYKGG